MASGTAPKDERSEFQLDLSRAPSVLFFYGLAGAGKSFVGELVGRLTGRQVYHADVDATPEMIDAIREKQTFSDEMRNRFFEVVAAKIEQLVTRQPRLIVTQAAYKQKHRDYLASRIPGMDFVCITARDDIITRRLRERGDHVPPEYAERIKSGFEPPPPGAKVLINNSDAAEVVRQLNEWYGKGTEQSIGILPPNHM